MTLTVKSKVAYTQVFMVLLLSACKIIPDLSFCKFYLKKETDTNLLFFIWSLSFAYISKTEEKYMLLIYNMRPLILLPKQSTPLSFPEPTIKALFSRHHLIPSNKLLYLITSWSNSSWNKKMCQEILSWGLVRCSLIFKGKIFLSKKTMFCTFTQGLAPMKRIFLQLRWHCNIKFTCIQIFFTLWTNNKAKLK